MEPALMGALIIACCFAAGTFGGGASRKRRDTESKPSASDRRDRTGGAK
ncbi:MULTISPECIES: hypothetical protein [Collinsella]|nr:MULTISPECIES: hypothetical protein [Collinsella]MBM6941861.1 hypothetical protein [Collinsella intestinalis]